MRKDNEYLTEIVQLDLKKSMMMNLVCLPESNQDDMTSSENQEQSGGDDSSGGDGEEESDNK